MTEDVHSANFNLCVLCANGRAQTGVNNDMYLPNPAHTSPRALAMFSFLGKLMGISLRHKHYLPFQFPPMVWKLLIGGNITVEDLAEVDAATVAHIREVARRGAAGAAEFEALEGSVFTVPAVDGTPVELIPDGLDTPLTPDNYREYVQLAIQFKLHEMDEQVGAMARGLGAIVPERALRLCTWSELELLVCGNPEVDVATLQRHTTYHGFRRSDRAVKYFWECLEEFPNEDRSKFIRMVWGRARLPKEGSWDKPFKLTLKSGGDDQLPLCHTCFFQIELPAYSSKEVMKKRLTTSITYGAGGGFLIA
jgi:E3 ubiquitin-protein ligase HERC1